MLVRVVLTRTTRARGRRHERLRRLPARADLIAAIAGRLQVEFKQRSAPGRVLALPDDDLLELGSGEARARYRRFDAPAARERAAAAQLRTVCRCRDAYPRRLRDLADPPAVMHVLGTLRG